MFFATYQTKNYIMKRQLFILLFTILSSTVFGQSDTEPIVQAFKSANIDNIAAHFDEFIDLKLLDKEDVKNMSKNQASIALKAFYTENGIKGFEKVSDGGKGTLIYLIGKLTTGNKSFNVTVQMKQKNGKPAIITIRIS
jgi:hypothetical protein